MGFHSANVLKNYVTSYSVRFVRIPLKEKKSIRKTTRLRFAVWTAAVSTLTLHYSFSYCSVLRLFEWCHCGNALLRCYVLSRVPALPSRKLFKSYYLLLIFFFFTIDVYNYIVRVRRYRSTSRTIDRDRGDEYNAT